MSGNGTAPCTKIDWLKGLLDDDEDLSDATPQLKLQEHEHEQKKVQASKISKGADKKLRKSPEDEAKISSRDDAIIETRKEQQESDSRVRKQKHQGCDYIGGEIGPEPFLTQPRRERGQRHQHLQRRAQSKNHSGKAHASYSVDTKDANGDKRRRKKFDEEKADKMPQRKRSHTELETNDKTDKTEKAAELQRNDPVGVAKTKAAESRQRRMKKLQDRRKATGEHERLAAVKLRRHGSYGASKLKIKQRVQMRKTQKLPAADICAEGKTRPPSVPLSAEEAKAGKRMLERQGRATTKAKKQLSDLKCLSALTLTRPRSAGSDKERQQQRTEELCPPGIVFGGNAELGQKRQRLGYMKGRLQNAVGSRITVNFAKETSENQAAATKNVGYADVRHENDIADSRSSACSGTNNVDGSGSQERPTQNQEPFRGTNATVDIKEEGQVECSALPRSASGKPVKSQEKDEQSISSDQNNILLDAAPIPRKSTINTSTVTSGASFVIPKRSLTNHDRRAEAQWAAQAIPADFRSDHNPLVSPVHVTVKPLSSDELSPQLSNRDPIRSQRKKTKNPVPVKNSLLSAHDKALMRLARKRNSIFLAAAELTAQPSPVDNTVPVTRMTGYEICDADGNVLPDLITRLSCATKHEMAANKDSFSGPFFGVSLAAPKAKRNVGQTIDECADVEGRRLNCYEELRFERPEDREFYQRRMYGTTFIPQHLRGRATLIVRSARFERKSTGIRFNQGRDREEFAASLSKRYTFKKSVPRCEIPRENWLKLTRNQPGAVYLHYNNHEDAERASYLFRDDAGNPLELKCERKTRLVYNRGSSQANGIGYHRTPRRSCSSERSLPKSSPQSSQGDSARNTPRWQRERQRATNRYSRYDRTPSEGREDRYNPSAGGRRARSRSWSRSMSTRLLSKQQHDSAAKGSGSETENDAVAAGTSALLSSTNLKLAPGGREDCAAVKKIAHTEPWGSNSTSKGDNDEDAEANAEKRLAQSIALSSPRTIPKGKDHHEQQLESSEGEQEEGEIESSIIPVTETTGRNNVRRGMQRSWSPCRSWQQLDDVQSHQRQEDYRDRPYEQYYNRVPHRRQSRSRSRSRPRSRGGGRDDGWEGSYTKERRYREYGPVADYDNDGHGRRMYSVELNRYEGRDYRDRRYNDRMGIAYSRP